MRRPDILLGGTTWPWWAQGLRGIVLVIAGILAMTSPGAALVGLALAIGLGLLIGGILAGISGLTLRRTTAPWGVMLATGIFEIIVGILVLSRPLLSAAAIPLVTALWAMIAGIGLFVSGLAHDRIPVFNGGLAMATGAILVLLGWLILANPPLGAMTIITLMGAALIVSGLMALAGASAMYRRRRRPMPQQERVAVGREEPPRRAA